MMRRRWLCLWPIAAVAAVALAAIPACRAQSGGEAPFVSATTIPEESLIQADALVAMLKKTDKPVIFQVGSRVMFAQAHIPGSEYAGPGAQAAGIQSLESRVASLPKDKEIVLYCGCCPWNRCPNVGPAYKRLVELGFTNVKVLYIANNFGDDWVAKKYPSVTGN